MPSLIFICGFCKASCGMQIMPVYLQVCAEEEIPGAWSFCFWMTHGCYVGCIAPPLWDMKCWGFAGHFSFVKEHRVMKSVCVSSRKPAFQQWSHTTCMQTFFPKSHPKSLSRQRRCPLKRFTGLQCLEKELWLQTATVNIAKSNVMQAAFCRLFSSDEQYNPLLSLNNPSNQEEVGESFDIYMFVW